MFQSFKTTFLFKLFIFPTNLTINIYYLRCFFDEKSEFFSDPLKIFKAVRDGKALVHALKNPPPLTIGGNAVSSSAAIVVASSSPPTTPDYTVGATHVLDVIHQLLAQQRQLEQKWQTRRVKLHQKLALLLFQQDVKQVSFVERTNRSRVSGERPSREVFD